MPLIVPVLRASFLFLNIFDTYKTLKVPPPSKRNGGHPTVRALSVRKRAMKGCMTVWLVWCCYAVYERTVDSIIGMFIPFYNEMKALILLFFLLTRSRGAEPIYLHIMRPMIRPYIGPLDSLVEITDTFGDLVVLICAIPYHMVMSIFSRFTPKWRKTKEEPGAEVKEEAEVTPKPATKVQVPQSRTANGEHLEHEQQAHTATVHGAVRTRRHQLQEAHDRAHDPRAVSMTPVHNGPSHAAQKKAGSHDIWIPPPPAYDESLIIDPSDLPHSLPTPPIEPAVVDEWRRYEPFPAAYPATPLPPPIRLAPSARHARPELEDISEDQSLYYSYIANETMVVEEQGFQQSLQLPRENPRSAGDLSDEVRGVRGPSYREHDMGLDSRVEDEEDEEDEEDDDDDFNVTLRTPAKMQRVKNLSQATTSSMDRDSNFSAAGLSTAESSSTRTRTNSGASATLYDSDTSSLAGKKRPLPSADERPIRRAMKDRQTSSSSSSQTVRARASTVRPDARHLYPMLHTRTSSSSNGSEGLVVADDAPVAPKVRRVGSRDENRREPTVRRPAMRPPAQPNTREAMVRKATSLANIPRVPPGPIAPKMSRRAASSRTSADGP